MRMSQLRKLAEGQEPRSKPLSLYFKGLQTTRVLVDVDWRIVDLLWLVSSASTASRLLCRGDVGLGPEPRDRASRRAGGLARGADQGRCRGACWLRAASRGGQVTINRRARMSARTRHARNLSANIEPGSRGGHPNGPQRQAYLVRSCGRSHRAHHHRLRRRLVRWRARTGAPVIHMAGSGKP